MIHSLVTTDLTQTSHVKIKDTRKAHVHVTTSSSQEEESGYKLIETSRECLFARPQAENFKPDHFRRYETMRSVSA